MINLGLKSIRGIVFDASGTQVYSKSFPVHTALMNEKVEQDAIEYVELLEIILDDIAFHTNLSMKIEALTVTTSSSCILGVNDQFEPVTKVLMVSDKRAAGVSKNIENSSCFAKLNKEEVPFCSASALVPKAIWFKENQPEIFERVKFWIGAGEFLNYFFTGKLVTDPQNASKAFYQKDSYPVDLLNCVGLPVDSLPVVYPIGQQFDIRDELKAKYHLHGHCRFVLTTYDAICAVVGSSDGNTKNACDVSGTVTSVRVMCERNQVPKKGNSLLLSQEIPLIDKMMNGASNNLGGGIIEWYKQAFFGQIENADVYSIMEYQAESVPAGANGIVFLPFLLGERSPVNIPNGSATFFGLNRKSTQKDLSRAVFESCGFVTQALVELIEENNFSVDKITVSGGLARFDIINQIKADITNKPVAVLDNFESTSVGAFVLMAISLKLFEYNEATTKEVIRIRKTIYPSAINHKIYKEYYSLYKELNNALTPLYSTHRSILDKRILEETEIVRNL
ncbi:MAG: FGGY-family carbohydrate kinase [Crocinitomicaceae bacterium]|nr:FGGY-family carbohydrate kinase [Crocinitomicaceae bacterium]